MELKAELIAIIGVVLVVVYFFIRRRNIPKQKTFRCARCSSIAQHTERTLNASREGKTSFFCNACHAQWVRSHPTRRAPARAGRSGERSGCLGVLACLMLIPIAIVVAWIYS